MVIQDFCINCLWSNSKLHISEYLATPSATYLGITSDDIVAYDLPSDDLSKKDIEALNAELSDPRFADSWWQDQINMMLELVKG